MAIVPLPLAPDLEARSLLHHLIEHGDLVGRDTAGRSIIQLAVDDWTLEKLMTFDADAAELEDEGDGEPDADDEENGLPVVVEVVPPTVVPRRPGPIVTLCRLGPWRAGRPSSSSCTVMSCRAFRWIRRTSSA